MARMNYNIIPSMISLVLPFLLVFMFHGIMATSKERPFQGKNLIPIFKPGLLNIRFVLTNKYKRNITSILINLGDDFLPLRNRFYIEKTAEERQLLGRQSPFNINIRHKRGISKGRGFGRHHSKMSLSCANCKYAMSRKSLNKRKKLHSHTIDHLTRKYRPHKFHSRSI